MRRRDLLLGGLAMVASSSAWATALQPVGADQILRGRFVQDRHLDGLAAPIRSEGRFLLVPGRGLLWQSQIPVWATTVLTARGITQTTSTGATSRLPTARAPMLARLYEVMSSAIAGDWLTLEQGMTLQRQEEGDLTRVTLTPRSAGVSPIDRIDIEARQFVERVRIQRSASDFDEIHFTDARVMPGPPHPDELVMFDAAS